MSDIFISYKREEQAAARKLADALEQEGLSVWWDPKLRVGEHFDDVIEKALIEAKCVIVIWSAISVQSRYVRDEATYALDRDKLVPVAIENVTLPFRFKGVQTLSLLGWDGSRDFAEFRRLVDDISAILRSSREKEVGLKPEQPNRRSIDQKAPNTWQSHYAIATAVGAVLIIIGGIFWWSKWQTEPVESKRSVKETTEAAGQTKADGQNETVKQPPLAKAQPQKPVSLTGKVVRDRLKNGELGPEMVVVPAGSFHMGDLQGGDQYALPIRTVKIQKPFAIGRYEVTFAEYDQFATAAGHWLPRDSGWGRDRRPVINILWRDAIEYAKWLSEQTGRRYRLPSEAEWEYAARGGRETAYWWGKQLLKAMANCNGCGSQWDNKQTSPVGSFKPNPFGLYDTSGNVWEWIEDCWHDNYNRAPADASAWTEASGGDCKQRVLRGGSWGHVPENMRSSVRFRYIAGFRLNTIGFRLAQDLD
jgi:formylglycine-generating enzyme required for sulfatase activity